MFILAVGAIGAAATQSTVARLREQAALESEAVQLAASLSARMLANPAQMALPDAANPYLQLDYDADDGDPDAAPVQCFDGADCERSIAWPP
ncbi:MAG TPA: type IV pilus modification protein PilV, partial [Massilia sp.]|nr:type IV pilus modification protein PilV [Massilia sp.]